MYVVPDVQIFELLWVKVVNLSGHIQNVLHSVENKHNKVKLQVQSTM